MREMQGQHGRLQGNWEVFPGPLISFLSDGREDGNVDQPNQNQIEGELTPRPQSALKRSRCACSAARCSSTKLRVDGSTAPIHLSRHCRAAAAPSCWWCSRYRARSRSSIASGMLSKGISFVNTPAVEGVFLNESPWISSRSVQLK